MKAVSKFAVLFSLGVLPSVATMAMTQEQFYVESCRQDSSIPVPISVVSPRVGPQYEGTTVQLEFTVDKAGIPNDIVVKSAKDFTVGLFVTQAVSQWRFKPALVDGTPVARKVELPVVIVEETRTGDRMTARK
jgi:Gram-negative bacterial TonB protein C-terminal